jgi:hypothetical protein
LIGILLSTHAHDRVFIPSKQRQALGTRIQLAASYFHRPVIIHGLTHIRKFSGRRGHVVHVICHQRFIGRYIHTAILARPMASGWNRTIVIYIAGIGLMNQQTVVLPSKKKSRRWRNLKRPGSMPLAGLARRPGGPWHTIHVPIGIVLFLSAFIHIIAAFYYATLAHLFGL